MKKKVGYLFMCVLALTGLAACGGTKIDEKDAKNVWREAEYTGTYEIAGYMSSTFGSHRSLELILDEVGGEKYGTYNASYTDIPNYITDYSDDIYLDLTFDGKGLSAWSIIDEDTQEDLGKMSEEELASHFALGAKYELIEAGQMPDDILLSNYELNKTYAFDLEAAEDGGYEYPLVKLTNDTDIPVLIVEKGYEADDLEETIVINKKIDVEGISFASGTVNSPKYYIIIKKGTVDDVLEDEDVKMLSECETGMMIDFSFEDYLYNDTDSTITLGLEGEKYTLAPGEIAECDWMDDIFVSSAE